jgi:hypothetical protein
MHRAREARPRGFEGTTTGSDHDRTLRPLVLSHAIENQNSDFVTPYRRDEGRTKSEF